MACSEVRAMPELHGATHRPNAHLLHIPVWSHVLAVHEITQIEEAMPTGVMDINKSHLPAHKKSFDVDTLLHIRQSSLHEKHPHCYMIVTANSGAIAILTLLLSTFRLRHLLTLCVAVRDSSTSNPAPQAFPPLPAHWSNHRRICNKEMLHSLLIHYDKHSDKNLRNVALNSDGA